MCPVNAFVALISITTSTAALLKDNATAHSVSPLTARRVSKKKKKEREGEKMFHRLDIVNDYRSPIDWDITLR